MRFAFSLLILLLLATSSSAQETEPEIRRVILTNGTIIPGIVEDENADPIVIRGLDGLERQFPASRVEAIEPLIRGRFFRTDPVRTRFFFAPTARSLDRGVIRGDFAGLALGVTAGLSDRVDALATGSLSITGDGFITPLLGVKGQIVEQDGVSAAAGVSALFVVGDGGGFVGLPYGVITLGDETRAVSVGAAGLVGGGFGLDSIDLADGVIIGIGGETQINNGVKLFVENLIGITGGDSGLVSLPGVRFFGDKFAFDVIGIVLTDFESVFGFAPVGARVSYQF